MEENKKPNNPIAFPTLIYNQTTGEPNGHEKGMTLRDYFAAKAMQSIIRKYNGTKSDAFDFDDDDETAVAVYSYSIADAMLKQREL